MPGEIGAESPVVPGDARIELVDVEPLDAPAELLASIGAREAELGRGARHHARPAVLFIRPGLEPDDPIDDRFDRLVRPALPPREDEQLGHAIPARGPLLERVEGTLRELGSLE